MVWGPRLFAASQDVALDILGAAIIDQACCSPIRQCQPPFRDEE